MILSTLIILSVLFIILATIVIRGLPAMNWSMITQVPKGGFYLGKEGGILNAITGSVVLAGGSTFLAVMMSIPIVLYLNIFTNRHSWLAAWARFSMDVLWGIPSIVYGAFGFTLMLLLGLRTSLLAGMITVSLFIFPIMSRAMDEVIRMTPKELLEASYSLGATKLETAFKVVIRQALPGIITAVLIAFGRGIGDAASVIFTAGFTDNLPSSLFRPVATLPLAIFFQLGTPFPEVQDRAYASAFILTIIILLISIISRILARRLTKHVIK
jgi:phosphate transport system permease protein